MDARPERGGPTEHDTVPFGPLLRRYRLAASLSQAALAERAGLSTDAITALERGRRTSPRLETVAAMRSEYRWATVGRVQCSSARCMPSILAQACPIRRPESSCVRAS